MPGFAIVVRLDRAGRSLLLGKADADEIPESFCDHSSERLAQPVVHDVINVAEVKKYRQAVDDALPGFRRNFMGPNRRHQLVGHIHQTVANDFFDVLQLIGRPEHAVAIHAQLAFILPLEIDSGDDILPGAFGEQGIDLGDKNTVLEHGNPAAGAIKGINIGAIVLGPPEVSGLRGLRAAGRQEQWHQYLCP